MSDYPHDAIQVSAPGKLMLIGEHAVVQRRACLVTAVSARLFLTVQLADPDDQTFTIRAPDVGVNHAQGRLAEAFANGQAVARGTRFIESALAVFGKKWGIPRGVQITTRSDFASTLGLGSSSATVACTLVGLAALFGVPLSHEDLFSAGLEAIHRVQNTGSGFDLAAAIWGGTLFYDNGSPRQVVPLVVPDLPLLAVYSGIKADTPTYVGRVEALRAARPAVVEAIFDTMNLLAHEGRRVLEAGDWEQLGQIMNVQHGLAHALGVDIAQTAALVFAAREAGAYGAKLSGAGGGDCVIVLVPEDRRAAVIAALQAAGGEIISVTPHAPGVRADFVE